MTPEETTKMHKACCQTCLLSTAMKNCKACRFEYTKNLDKNGKPLVKSDKVK